MTEEFSLLSLPARSYELIGRIVSQCALIELKLCGYMARMVGANALDALAITSKLAARTRIDVFRMLARDKRKIEKDEELKKLCKLLNNLNDHRNELVHGVSIVHDISPELAFTLLLRGPGKQTAKPANEKVLKEILEIGFQALADLQSYVQNHDAELFASPDKSP